MGKQKIGRNEPCHCGSGRKYKKCHRSADRGQFEEASSRLTARERWIADRILQDPRFRIWYVVPHPDQDLFNATPLQFYSPGIVDTARIFSLVATLPADIRELTADYDSIFIFRCLGLIDRRVVPIQFSSFRKLLEQLPALCRRSKVPGRSAAWQCRTF
jgi:hypothetical protein